MISQTAEYALRACLQLARQPERPCTVEALAEATSVPSQYLAKVLQALAKAGIVRSRRGVRGGFSLAIDPHELSVYDVVNAVDPWQRITSCPLGLTEHARSLCLLHARLDRAMAEAEEALRRARFSELTAAPKPNACQGLMPKLAKPARNGR